MKKVAIVIILSIFTLSDVSAQWTTSGTNIYNSNTGNVGIGVSAPLTALHVNGGITSGRLGYYGTYSSTQIQGIWSISAPYAVNLANNDFGTQYGMGYAFSTNGGAPFLNEHQIVFTNNGVINGTISLSGNVKFNGTGNFGINGLFGGSVGIGTTTPLSKLHIEEHIGRTTFTGAGIGTVIIRNLTGTSNYSMLDFSGGSSNLNAQSRIASLQTSSGSYLQFGTSNSYASGITNTAMTIDYIGNVGIGTTTPGTKLDINGTTYSRKLYVGTPDANIAANMGSNNLLAVNGTAVFVKAKVAVYGSAWPDYVFSPNYKLTPLDSLEQFIQLNKHLPEVPSADDVQKNGVDLGDNQALLLKKIEELTLIMIEQNKKIEQQSIRISLLEKKLN